MPIKIKNWGIDLHLLKDLSQQYSRDRGSDLCIQSRHEAGRAPRQDLETLTGEDNLKQALLLRFLTPVGELAQLGHPSYGSKLFDLLGLPNNETNRNRTKMYVLQSLKAEPRVEKVISVIVAQNERDKTCMDIKAELKAVDRDEPVVIEFPFFLEAGA